jgi:peroxiredoxin
MKTKLFPMLAIIILATSSLIGQGYKIGDVAEDFKLKNVDGKMLSMADFTEAKGFILIFTCNHCPYSIVYEDRIIDLDKKYKSQGFPVIAINPNDPEVVAADSYENMIKRSTEKGFTFPYLFDEGQKVYPKYGATRTPHVYIVNKEAGKFIVKYIGAIDDNDQNPDKVKKRYIEMAVESLLKGEKVAVTETKAIGCTIKKKK